MISRVFLVFLLASAFGCNRQDTDALSRIGHKLASLAHDQSDNLRDKYQVSWSLTPGLKEKIERRLSWDKALSDAKIDVVVSGKEVELKGTLANDEQRRHAVALAESTTGVDKVVDSLQISMP